MEGDRFARLWKSDSPAVRIRALAAVLRSVHATEVLANEVLLEALEALCRAAAAGDLPLVDEAELSHLLVQEIACRHAPELVAPLLHYLGDPEARMRRLACEALGQLGDARAIQPLLGLAQDPDCDVRITVDQALDRLGYVPPPPPDRELLSTEGSTVMYLHMTQPWNLDLWRAQELKKQKDVPCVCRVGRHFKVVFEPPLPESEGLVHGWDEEQIRQRAPDLVGGPYLHHCHAIITLDEVGQDVYRILDLSMFYESLGWCPIVVDGEYGPLGDGWVQASSRAHEEEMWRQERAATEENRRQRRLKQQPNLSPEEA
jgi:HEAT repeat protein